MYSIAFFDTEVDPNSRRILDIGSIKENGDVFHSNSIGSFIKFLRGTQYICGHNIIMHDLKYIQDAVITSGIKNNNYIDTLFLSPLLFPMRPYHSLLKDDKLQTDDLNNPLNDSIKARDLFFDEVMAFEHTDNLMKQVFYGLLKDRIEFSAFFRFIDYNTIETSVEILIRKRFKGSICENVNLKEYIEQYPVELAYCLALINTKKRNSITPPWVLKSYPLVEYIMFLLRSNPCANGCTYCTNTFDSHKWLKYFFGFNSFRTYAGKPLQEQAVNAAIMNKSLLAVFPTGGGKSITFQLPALINGATSRGLTVVISPLQSLMKDQVDNLEKSQITEAVTINGLLDPIERAKSIERVENGSASILYISPESLRSKTIEHLMLGRNISRFVIDEAHCFSSWGQDFRVDYLYIADFIKILMKKKNLKNTIPISCFTATARKKVIEDICNYFKEKLSIELEVFTSNASRTNLLYKVFQTEDEEDKYNRLREIIQQKNCPTIVYVTRTKRAFELALRLSRDGYEARPYHGKMDKKEKSENQDAFVNGDVQIMVATSAFGMGVDKKDVGLVIHYEISDSLENYIQEAGRAGRDEKITADCYAFFDDEDLNKHFMLLNQTKLSIQEIQHVWRAIKGLTRFRSTISQSALEIGRKAGWDDNILGIETKVKTAIAALEEAGYIKRGQNIPRVFADSILTKNVQEAIDKINASNKFEGKKQEKAIRIIKKLISCKSRKEVGGEETEARIDYISDHLGIVKEEVIEIINLLREENILAYAKDLKAFIKKKQNVNRSLRILKTYWQIEKYLLSILEEGENVFHIKKLNEDAEQDGCKDVTTNKIKTIFNFWTIKNWIRRKKDNFSNSHIGVLPLSKKENLQEKLSKRYEIAQFILEYLFEKVKQSEVNSSNTDEVFVEFSVFEIKDAFENRQVLIKTDICVDDIQDALFYLSRIEAIKIEGGFLVIYNTLTIERLEKGNKIRYKVEDYKKLKEYYDNKIQQVHMVGEYAKKMVNDYKDALCFVNDYFMMDYKEFLSKYFNGDRIDEIKRPITPNKFDQLFRQLSPTQLNIIKDNQAQYIVVAAGPGSGKTRVLVHKLASLLFMEDVKHEQLLMLTFSRAAAIEFKKRLLDLIGNAANYIEIKTFHSYCFDLLGKVGSLEKSDDIIIKTIKRIKNGEVELERITKTVLVIDEAQDMDENEFSLINTLMDYNEDMRVIAVGDDDQNIYEFRGSSAKYMEHLINDKKASFYELIQNFRSKKNLVDFSNQYARIIPHRLKKSPIHAAQNENGRIKLVKHKSINLIEPLVSDIISCDLTGSTCVLTKTNEEALRITGLLIKNNLKAKLIQSNDGFNLYNLLEIRYFLNQLDINNNCRVVSSDEWENAKSKLANQFVNSTNLELCTNIIKDFEATNTKIKYKTDLDIFIRESKIEDFYDEKKETIFVSTIHKSKGREFKNVFLMLDRFKLDSDEAKRQLYVAMTRAKDNLIIHSNGNFLDFISTEDLYRINDYKLYPKPYQIAVSLTFRDVFLDFFIKRQNLVSQLNCGDVLKIAGEYCFNSKGQNVIRFSKKFIEKLNKIKKNGYYPVGAKIRYIVFWKKEDSETETKIILPDIYFKKRF